jgi:hypothetical protein
MTELLAIMHEMKSLIERHGAAHMRETMAPGEVHAFGDKLEQFEPFKTIATKWLVSPMGGGAAGHGQSGRWVWMRMLDGAQPQQIIASAQATLDANRYEAWEVRAVKGIETAKTHHLSDTMSLVPNQTLRSSWIHARAFSREMLGSYFANDTAALVYKVVVEPAFLEHPDTEFERKAAAAVQERRDTAARVRLALGLACGGPVEMPYVYAETDSDCLFSEALNSFSRDPSMNFWGMDREVDIDRVRSLLDQFEKMDSPEALELSIHRLLRSRHFTALEDRIIDLGMAAEIALMHSKAGTGDGKAEITNKLANRGAWLLGGDAAERVRLANLFSELYSARSLVVHTGAAKAKLGARMAEFDDLVSRTLLALLERGGFPDWKALVLGG